MRWYLMFRGGCQGRPVGVKFQLKAWKVTQTSARQCGLCRTKASEVRSSLCKDPEVSTGHELSAPFCWSHLQESRSWRRASQRAWTSPSSSLDFSFAGPEKGRRQGVRVPSSLAVFSRRLGHGIPTFRQSRGAWILQVMQWRLPQPMPLLASGPS